MPVSPQGISVTSLYRDYRDGKLLVNRQYQRKLVWTVPEKQRLVDSMLQDFPLPLFLFADVEIDGASKFEIIDGMQRLNAIFGFIEHNYLWEEKCFDLAEFARARQASEEGLFKVASAEIERLSKKDCANFLDYQLAVTTFPGEKDERITKVFGRINSGGKQLSDQERRQAGVLTPFAELVRELSAEIRGDVSKKTLLLSEMPQISIESPKNVHGYALKADEIFWCEQGVLRTNDLRDSEDEQIIADICASILKEEPLAATADNLNKLYDPNSDESKEINAKLAAFGDERLSEIVKVVFSVVKATFSDPEGEKYFFRRTVYPKPTSNALKTPFFSIFMAFYHLIYRDALKPADMPGIVAALQNVTDKIDVGMKHMKSEDLARNIDVVDGLIRKCFTKDEPQTIHASVGSGFDFENSLRRSKTERNRYEYKQGLLRLSADRKFDEKLVGKIINTIAAIANVGPDEDGYLYVGVADDVSDAERIRELDKVEPLKIDDFYVVGIDREAEVWGSGIDGLISSLIAKIKASELSGSLKDQVIHQIDTINYKGFSVVRIRIPKQGELSFVGEKCFIRESNSTVEATGTQIASIAKLF